MAIASLRSIFLSFFLSELDLEKNNNTKAENMVMDKLKIHSLVAILLLCSDVLIHPMKNENPIAMERMMSR